MKPEDPQTPNTPDPAEQRSPEMPARSQPSEPSEAPSNGPLGAPTGPLPEPPAEPSVPLFAEEDFSEELFEQAAQRPLTGPLTPAERADDAVLPHPDLAQGPVDESAQRQRTGPLAGLRDEIQSSDMPAAPVTPVFDDPLYAAETPSDSAPPDQPASTKAYESDYMTEIRQSLQSEDAGTGGLLRRITGSLRKVTGSLRKATGPLPPAPASAEPEPPKALEQRITPTEMADDFVSGRLGEASAAAPSAAPLYEEDLPDAFFAPVSGENAPVDSAGSGAPAELPVDAADRAQADRPIDLSDLGMPVFDEDEPEPDWMAEIRQEAAGGELPVGAQPPAGDEPQPEPPAEKTKTRRAGPLAFLTGILRRPEERRKPKQTGSLSDEMVTGRLERSLGTAPAQEQPPAEEAIPLDRLFPEDTPSAELPPELPGMPPAARFEEFETYVEPPADLPPPLFAAEDVPFDVDAAPLFAEEDFLFDQDAALLEGLESRFGQFGEDAASAEPLAGLSEETDAVDITAEDGALLWDSDQPAAGAPIEITPMDGVTFTPEDVWGEEELPAPEQPRSRATRMTHEEALAASFLTGEDVLPDSPIFSQDQLLREALEKSPGGEEIASFEEMRAIALQGYQELGIPEPLPTLAEEAAPSAEKDGPSSEEAEAEKTRQAAAEATAAQVEAFEREEQAAGPFNLKHWLATRTFVQKFLLAEAALVAVALLIAIPLFLYMIFRGTAQTETPNYASPAAFPADLPYPTGLQLPGGWYFQLQKSTFVQGQWTPQTSEWLEGTELRRVVALPWNPQTQAVVNSFQPGDAVLLGLSNGQTVEYTVSSVERVTANNTQILNDPSPSLVIILYQEDAQDRWVVFCEP